MNAEPDMPDEETLLVRNDKGDDELVAWDPDSGESERTFNETDFFGLPDKSTATESFVGTGAIAFAPSVLPARRVRRPPKRRKPSTESPMADQRRRLAEETGSWFKEGPVRGDHRMDPPGGEGVARRTATKDTTGKQDTRFTQSGNEWPRKHKGNLAMGTPEDHGQGSSGHNSEPGKPDDGYQEPTGHDWPDEPVNSGQGVAEPFDRTLEGTEMPKGTPPKGFGAGAPASDGDGRTNSEDWSLGRISSLMESDVLEQSRLQQLFDAYARETDYVCLESFTGLLRAHGAGNLLDHQGLLTLMGANRQFVFHERRDASGPYWLPRAPLTEARQDGGNKGKGGKVPEAFRERQGNPPRRKKPGGLYQANARSGGKRRQKPSFLKSESADPNRCCQGWLDTATEIRHLLQQGHITPTNARRALQLSFNARLRREHLLGCSRPVLESVRRYVDHFGLSLDRGLQRARDLWEARYGEAGGPDDPFDDELPDVDNPGMRRGTTDEFAGGADRPYDDQSRYDLDEFGLGPDASDIPDPRPIDPAAMADEGDFDNPDFEYDRNNPPTARGPRASELYGAEDEHEAYGADLPPLGGDRPGGLGAGPGDGFEEFDRQDAFGDDPGLDPSPVGDTWGSRAGGSYGDDPVGDAMAHARQYEGLGDPAGLDTSDEELDGPDDTPPGRGATRGRYGAAGRGGFQESRRSGRRTLKEDESWFQDGPTRTASGHRMDQDGEPVGGDLGNGHTSGLFPEEDADFTEEGGEDPLDRDQENSGDGQVEFTHGGEGTMRGGRGPRGTAPEPKAGIKENIGRLGRHVGRRLQECSGKLPTGQYSLRFLAVVAGRDRQVHRAPRRATLSEALADAEELLLLYGRRRVMLEAAYLRGRQEVHRERIALPTVRRRGPFLAEGGVLFRFPKHAEQYARELLREGAACRVVSHNWGTAVEAKVPGRLADAAFSALLENFREPEAAPRR